MVRQRRERVVGRRRAVRERHGPDRRLADRRRVGLQRESSNERLVILEGQLHQGGVRMLTVRDARVLIRASALQKLGIAVRPVDQRLEARAQRGADHARADGAHRAGHLPVDEAELASTVDGGLRVVLGE